MVERISKFQMLRLREAREARGLSAVALADLIGVDRSAVSHYENGRHAPSMETLTEIAEKLRVPLQRFFTPAAPDPGGVLFWRSRAAATKLAQLRAARRFGWLAEVVDYVLGYVTVPPATFPLLKLPADPRELSDERVEEAAVECRRYWSLGDGPISNVVLLLENNGAIVVRCSLGEDTLDAFSHWHAMHARPYFVLSSDRMGAARSLLNVAHELGHMVLHRHIDTRLFNTSEVHKLMEHQAMIFAGAFLLPEATFSSDLYSVSLEAFVSLKAKWRVSVQAMVTRATHLGLVSEQDAKSIWVRIARRGWRQHEPLDDTLPIEQPRLLERCFDLMAEQRVDPNAMSTALSLQLSDIEEVCGLPPGRLTADRRPNLKFKLVV